MLNDQQLSIIKKEMELGAPIAAAAKKHKIEITSPIEVRKQLFDKYGKDVIVKIVKENILPSTRDMADSLKMSIKQSAKRAVKGEALFAKKEEIEKRQTLCESCDFYDSGRCLKCGCFMKVKSKMQSSSCPLKKW
jgi:hypothetical protein